MFKVMLYYTQTLHYPKTASKGFITGCDYQQAPPHGKQAHKLHNNYS